MSESVLCVDLGDLSSERLIPPANLNAYVLDGVRRDRLFRPRSEVEDTNATRLRHLVPYLILVSSDLKRFLVYRRGLAGAELRLRGEWAIGFGGHLNKEDFLDSDGSVEGAARVCMARELKEELGLNLSGDVMAFRHLGWLASSATEVSRVHLGMVWAIFLSEGAEDRLSPEANIAAIRWMTPAGLTRFVGRAESWSGILYRSLFQARSLRHALLAQYPEEPVARVAP
ncbi:MAG: NUDIX domain-containing protein [Bacillota bacterium]